MLAKRSIHLIAAPFLLAGIFYWLDCLILTILAIAVGIIFIVFFRDPEREIAKGVCAPADGKIREVKEGSQTVRISTFMNVHNVHVNRAPLDGRVLSIRRKRGSFSPAFMPGASENSRVITMLDTNIGKVKLVQISGVFAWRIVPYIRRGQTVKKGRRIGIIRFGSRVDLYLPKDKVKVCVDVGQKVKAGSTMLAEVLA